MTEEKIDKRKFNKFPTQGRPVGTKNKIAADIRAMIEGALEDVGGREYFARQAKENPVAYMGLLGKLLPNKVSGPDGEDLRIHIIERVMVRPGSIDGNGEN